MRSSWFATIILVGTLGAVAGSARLAPGDGLPRLDTVSLASEPGTLPADSRDHVFILVVGFSKAAAKVTSGWLDACRVAGSAGPPGSAVRCYDVRMLEDVPRAFRGMIERGMRSGLSIELQRRTLLVYAENDLWRERLGVADAKTAYVVGCDASGRVQGITTGPFDEAALHRLLASASSPKASEP